MPEPESSSENPWSILWTSVELSPRTTELRTAIQATAPLPITASESTAAKDSTNAFVVAGSDASCRPSVSRRTTTSVLPVSTPQVVTAYAVTLRATFTGPILCWRMQDALLSPSRVRRRVRVEHPYTEVPSAYTRATGLAASVRAWAGPHEAA